MLDIIQKKFFFDHLPAAKTGGKRGFQKQKKKKNPNSRSFYCYFLFLFETYVYKVLEFFVQILTYITYLYARV